MRLILSTSLLMFLATAESDLRASEAGELATLRTLEKQAWEAWRSNDLAAIKRLCAPDYVSTDGEVTVTLAEIERSIAGTRIRQYGLGEMKAVRVSRDVVVLYFLAEVDGTEFGKEIPHHLSVSSVWVRRSGRWLSVFVHEAPVKKP